ncbi:MAG: hypothetical protein WC956_05195 [bacterium]
MGQRMTWEEMKKAYPDEWLLITDYERDRYGNVSVGVVERHSSDKDEVYRLPALKKDAAFEYTGESSFRGFRDHAEHHCF